MIYAAGVSYLLLTMLLYVPGVLVYRSVQKEAKLQTIFTRGELATAIGFTLLAVLAIYELAIGTLSI
jgi:arginine:ornithine antiporter/lysine permease